MISNTKIKRKLNGLIKEVIKKRRSGKKAEDCQQDYDKINQLKDEIRNTYAIIPPSFRKYFKTKEWINSPEVAKEQDYKRKERKIILRKKSA